MNPTQNPNFQNQPPFKCKPLTTLLWASALLTLILSLSLESLNPIPLLTFPFKFHPHPLKPNPLQKFLSLISPPPTYPQPVSPRPPCVLWMAPFLSPGGYSSEAWSYITSLSSNADAHNITLQIEHHGDSESFIFWLGLPGESRSLAEKLFRQECRLNETIVVCHSEPGAWFPPLYQTSFCPPTGYGDALFVVGRTMFETDRVNQEHVHRCNRMDAIWVPTEFHVSTFVKSGVDQSKVVKLVQPVDVEFFDPLKYQALDLDSYGNLVLGLSSNSDNKFVFLSVFKWEYRKGWDVLLKSYLEEFSSSDGVALYLLVSSYHSDRDFSDKILKFVEEMSLEEPTDGWAPVHVIGKHVPQRELPRLYKAVDAFVLPTRGEGWGRPIVEAMAMELPVICTYWSGPTEYLTEENGYPLPVERMSEVVDGPFAGHLWAEPSSDELRRLMRHLLRNPEEGRGKGRKAREDMIQRFSPEVVARLLADEIMKITKNQV